MKRLFSTILPVFMLLSSTGNGILSIRAETDEEFEEPVASETFETETEQSELTEEPEEEVPILIEAEEPEAAEEPEQEDQSAAENSEENALEETDEEPAEIMDDSGYTATVTYQLSEGEYMIVNDEQITGSYTETIDDFYGYYVAPSYIPVKEGYQFYGWKVTANGAEQSDIFQPNDGMMLDDENGTNISDTDAEIICVPVYNKLYTFTVTYHLNMEGASYQNNVVESFDKQYIDKDVSTFGGFPRPYKEGKAWLGWAFTSDAATWITEAQLFEALEDGTSQVDLYAVWEEATVYQVVFRTDPNEGYLYLDENGQPVYEYIDEYPNDVQLWHPYTKFLYPTSTVEGKIFAGWEYETYDSFSDETITINEYPGSQIWFTGPDPAVFDENNQQIRTAVWADGESHTMRLHLNGGTLQSRSEYVTDFVQEGDVASARITQYDYQNYMPLPSTDINDTWNTQWKINKPGQTLRGWSLNEDPSEEDELFVNLYEVFGEEGTVTDVELYAVWDESNVTVQYYKNAVDAILDPARPDRIYKAKTYMASDDIVIQMDVTREGYTLLGWARSQTDAANGIIDFTDGQNAGKLFENETQLYISLYAVWAPEAEQTFTATLHLNGGSLFNCDEYTKVSDDVYQFTFTEEDVVNRKLLPVEYFDDGEPGIEKKWYRWDGWSTEDEDIFFWSSLYDGFEDRAVCDIELYASWKEVTGVVYYYPNAEDALMIGESVTDGTRPVINRYKYPDEVHITQMAVRENYVLAGWAKDEEHAEAGIVDYHVGDKAAFEEIFTPYIKVILYAVWKEKAAEMYKVSFKVNGGEIEGHPANKSGIAAFEITADELDEIEAVKKGYMFNGWFTDSKLTKEMTPEMFASDPKNMTLYAKYAPVPYHVLLHANADDAYILVNDLSSGGQYESSTDFVNATFGTAMAITAKPVRPGYTFKGWAETADGDVKYKSGTKYKAFAEDPEFNGTVDLYAVWTINTYTLKLNTGGGTVDGLTVKKNVASTKFNAENVSEIQNRYIFSSETIHRAGYVFKGWYSDKKFKNPVWTTDGEEEPVKILKDLTLYAKWEAKTYNVVLHANADDAVIMVDDVSSGGQRPSSTDDVSAVFGKAMALTAKPIRPGYTFKGWAETSDGAVKYKSGTKYKSFAADPELDGIVDLYAVWSMNTYTLKLNTNGGTIDGLTVKSGKATVKYNAENAWETQSTYIFSGDMIHKAGYVFKGWYMDKKFKNPVWTPGEEQPAVRALQNLTLYAKWEAKTYNVALHVNADDAYMLVDDVSSGGQRPISTDYVNAVFGKAMALTAKPIRPGYTFKGWAETSDGAVKYKSGTKYKSFAADPELDGTVDLYAVWTPVTYTIKINVNGGKVQDLKVSSGVAKTTYTVEDTSSFKYLTDTGLYSRSGYTFGGLYTDKALSAVFDQAALPNPPGNITVYVKWVKE